MGDGRSFGVAFAIKVTIDHRGNAAKKETGCSESVKEKRLAVRENISGPASQLSETQRNLM